MPSDYKLIYDDHRLDYGRKLTLWAQDHRMSDRIRRCSHHHRPGQPRHLPLTRADPCQTSTSNTKPRSARRTAFGEFSRRCQERKLTNTGRRPMIELRTTTRLPGNYQNSEPRGLRILVSFAPFRSVYLIRTLPRRHSKAVRHSLSKTA